MSMQALTQLQEALYMALNGDETLTAHVTGVYDEAPPGSSYPFIAFGGTTLTSGNLKDTCGGTIDFNILIYSNEPSQMQVKELSAMVSDALEKAAIDLLDHTLVTLRLVNSAITRQWDENGSLYRARLNYNALVYAD